MMLPNHSNFSSDLDASTLHCVLDKPSISGVLFFMGRKKLNQPCKVCGISDRMKGDSYCHECRKIKGRENYHRKWDKIPNQPMGRFIDLTGLVFHRLTVLGLSRNKNNMIVWKCRCECGNIASANSNQLKQGKILSCGCYHSELIKKMKTIHGVGHETPEFRAWCSMKRRCLNKTVKEYNRYGGRGIKVCDRWLLSYENFIEDMGERPSDKHSLDRIDTNGMYKKDNCRWALPIVQQRNRRNNVLLTINGVTKLLIVWGAENGISEGTIRSRYQKGRVLDESILKPINAKRKIKST